MKGRKSEEAEQVSKVPLDSQNSIDIDRQILKKIKKSISGRE